MSADPRIWDAGSISGIRSANIQKLNPGPIKSNPLHTTDMNAWLRWYTRPSQGLTRRRRRYIEQGMCGVLPSPCDPRRRNKTPSPPYTPMEVTIPVEVQGLIVLLQLIQGLAALSAYVAARYLVISHIDTLCFGIHPHLVQWHPVARQYLYVMASLWDKS